MAAIKHTINDYAGLFGPGGIWRREQAEKGEFFTDKSLRTRDAVMKNWIVPIWGRRDVRRLTVAGIDEGMKGLVSPYTCRPLAGETKNRILSVLSELYCYLVRKGLVRFNPVRDVKRYNQRPVRPRGALKLEEMDRLFPGVIPEIRFNILLPDTHERLMGIWRTQRYVCAFLILKDTGLRPGELIALRWADWDSELMFFPIVKAIESGSRDRVKGTKTGSVKPAIITERAAAEIEALRKKLKPRPLDFIFADKHGTPYDTHRLSWNFREAVKRAGIDRPEYTPYWLRHTFNTRMLETLPESLVQRLTGHNSEAMTRRYRHADEESLAREARRIRAEVNSGRLY